MFRSGESSSPTRKGALSIGRIPTNRDVVRAGGSRRRLRAGRPPYSGHRWERHSRTRRRLPLSAGSISPGVVPSPNAPQRPSTRIGPKRDIGSRQIRAYGIIHVARITARHEVTPVRRRKVARVADVAAEVFFSPRHVLGLSHAGQWLRIYHGTHRKHYVLARDAYGRATLLRGRWWMNGRAGAIADGTSPSLPGRVNPEGSRRWGDALGYGRDALVASVFFYHGIHRTASPTQNTQNVLGGVKARHSVFSVYRRRRFQCVQWSK